MLANAHNPSIIKNIVVIGDYEDPLYHWFYNRLRNAEEGGTLSVSRWCLDDPAFSDSDLIAPPAEMVINTTLEKSAFARSAYLASSKMEGHNRPSIIFQNVLCQTLFDVRTSFSEDYDWVGYSAFSLYGRFEKSPLPALELCQIEAGRLLEHQAFLEALNIPSIQSPACPALILGRIVAMLVNEACSALMEDVASPEAIDTAMTLGTNYPMGPLRWADAAGLDVILAILNHLYEIYKEPRYRPVRLLRERVAQGVLGQKSGRGFYAHPIPVQL